MPKIIHRKVDVLDYRDGSGGTIEIYDIVVNSERGVGRGEALFRELLEKENPKRVFAFCRDDNTNAHAYYERLGFKGTHLPAFYPDGGAIIYVYEASQ